MKDVFIGSAFVMLLYTGCYFLPKSKPATTQDINCRSFARDGANAKTQAEYNFAKQRFDGQCNGWTDPDRQ